jgi:hypothetical protein
VQVNEQICRLPPVEETLTPEEKKRPKLATFPAQKWFW